MILDYTPEWVFVKTTDPKSKHILKNVMNAQELKKGYRIPKTLWALREMVRYFRDLKDNPDFVNEGLKLQREQKSLLSIKSISEQGFEKDFLPNLRPYQRHDVMYLRQIPAAGVFNEPRTGKTPTMISLVKELGTKRNLIVAPASLIYNWAKEFELWYPECEVYVASGSKRKFQYDFFSSFTGSQIEKRVLIVSKDTWKMDWETFKGIAFDVAILDEAHYLRNYKTAQAKAVFKINAKRRYALTGTATVKHASDIFGILHFLFPKMFPSYWQFVDRYFEQSQDWMGHKVVGNPKPERINELQEMIALNSVQRKRKEVMQWLPEKQRSTFNIMVDGKQRKLYDDMKKVFVASDLDVEADAPNVITQLMRLRQLCLDPRLLGFETEGAKTVALLEYLENHREPIVIMSMFTSYLKLLKPLIEKLNLKVGFIHGEMSNKAKQESTVLFQQGRIDVLLCNIISAGTGHTLDQATTVIFTDKAWNPAENDQAEDRICPTTEEKNHKHEIITFTCQGTVDARIDELLDQKISLTDYINNGGAAALKRLLGV